MSLTLTPQDRLVLRELSSSITRDASESEKVYLDLCRGFETYADEEMISGSSSSTQEQKNAFFRERHKRLWANLPYAGQSSEVVFPQNQNYIYSTFRRLGIPSRDLDDMTQYALIKLWRFNHAEKYNPLTSSWKHHLLLALSRMRASYYERRQRDPLALGFAFQQYDPPSDNDELTLEPYLVEQGLSPQDKMILEESLQDFEKYLATREPYRCGVEGNHKECCTLLPPGTKDFPLSVSVTAQIVRKSGKNCRISVEGEFLLWPRDLLSDIRPNDVHNNPNAAKTVRTPLQIYHLLMNTGAQIEQIVLALRVAESTAHNWIRDLEQYFQHWWRHSPVIRDSQRWKALPVVKCPACSDEHVKLPPKRTLPAISVERDGHQIWVAPSSGYEGEVFEVDASWCDNCNSLALDSVKPRIRLPYPWGYVRSNHDLLERSSKYKSRLTVQRCRL